MNGPKWLVLFLAALLVTFVIWGVMNILIDPFGVFGDVLFSWDAYGQTLNPRIGKTEYLEEHFDEFDSYIVGSSSAASYLPDTLEKYNEGNYYNLFHYGADIAYDARLIAWLLENDEVRHIVLVLGLNEADTLWDGTALTDRAHYAVTGENSLRYYLDFLLAGSSFALEKLVSHSKDTEMPQAFDVFIPEDGTYDKRLRDVESIGNLDAYFTKNGGDFLPLSAVRELQYIEECVSTVKSIKEMCDLAGVELTVIMSPVSEQQLQGYTNDSLNTYFTALGQVTEYWNFSISCATYDARYFYDTTHPRNALGNMVLARIYEDEYCYYPDNFGIYCANGDVRTAEWMKDGARTIQKEDYTVNVPILLYHHLDLNQEESGTVLHPDTFASHMALLAEHGYTPVSFEQIIAYVERGEALPDKPVVITFDDGYLSNYQYAYPILQEYGWKAAIFVIGSSVGHEYYKDTEKSMIPHFGEQEIEEMLASDLISIQSHTWDMHQWAPYESGEEVRGNILPLPGEKEAEYIASLKRDIEIMEDFFVRNGWDKSQVLAFPTGKYTEVSNVILAEKGYKVTLTTDSARENTLVCGLPQSMLNLGRLNVSGDTTEEMILAYCKGN